jgi:hypothetical protein
MHIMVDIETMGTGPDAPILSIGAVAFNGAGLGDEFYKPCNFQSAVDSGAVIDPSTVMWWLRQDAAALNALEDCQDSGITLTGALQSFLAFVNPSHPTLRGVWGNGATFDNVIIRQSCKRLGLEVWPFWLDKCYRTVKGAYPAVKMERVGTHHNALDDAKSQALHLIEINRAAGGVFL